MTAMVTDRFRDSDAWLAEMAADPIDVACPRCACRALSAPLIGTSGTPEEMAWHAGRRLTCGWCGHEDVAVRMREFGWGGPADPFFRAPLWLQTVVRGERLWAFHERHLDVIDGFVTAVRGRRGGEQGTIAGQPGWMTGADHRDDVRAAIGRLRALLDGDAADEPARRLGDTRAEATAAAHADVASAMRNAAGREDAAGRETAADRAAADWAAADQNTAARPHAGAHAR